MQKIYFGFLGNKMWIFPTVMDLLDTMSDLAATYSVIKESKSSHSSIIIMFAVIEQNDLTFSNSHFAAPKPINNPVQKSFILIRILIFFSRFCHNDNCEFNLWVKNKNSRMKIGD